MKANYGGNIHTRTGIMASAIPTPQYFRFCPECLQDDLNKYGETYWHRLHQTPGVLFCPTHKIPLQDSKIIIQGLNKHVYHAANQDNCPAEAKELNYSGSSLRTNVLLKVKLLLYKQFKVLSSFCCVHV